MLRDRDANTAWTAPADGTLEERRYSCQNWRSDVSVVLTEAGKMVEWIKYSAHGIAYALPVGDTDSDGDWDATDKGNMTGPYNVRKDANLDGVVDSNDEPHANSITGGYQTLGWNTLTSSGVNNRIGYAGYQFAPELAGNKWHVRNRMLDSVSGNWSRRDLLGYVDGMNLYQYVRSMPIVGVDPMGLLVSAVTACSTDPKSCSGRCGHTCTIVSHVPSCASIEFVRCTPSPNNPKDCPDCRSHALEWRLRLQAECAGGTALSTKEIFDCDDPCTCRQRVGIPCWIAGPYPTERTLEESIGPNCYYTVTFRYLNSESICQGDCL